MMKSKMASSSKKDAEVRRTKFTYSTGIVLILLLGFTLRIFNLERMPPFVHWDEINQAIEAVKILQGEVPLLGVSYHGSPSMVFFEHAPYLLFGNNLWALRITSALWSMLMLSAAYFGVKQMFGPRVAIVAILLMATAHMLIHFGRVSTNVLQAIPSSFLAIGLYVKAQRQQDLGLPARRLYLLAGAALALNLYEYVAARATLFGIAALWFFSIPRDKAAWRVYARGTILFATGFLAIAAPILWWYVQHPQDLVSRAQTLSVFGAWGAVINEQLYGKVNTPTLLFYQTLRSLGGFFITGDTSPNYRFDVPLIDLGTAILLLPGLVLAWRLRPKLTAATLIWMAAGLIAGAILTIEPPTSTHYIVLVPLAIVFAAVCLDWLATSPVGRVAVPIILVGLGVLNIFLYFSVYPYKGAWYSLETNVGFFVRDTQGCCTVWYLGEPHETPQQISAFIAAPIPIRYVQDLGRLDDVLTNASADGRPDIVIIPEDEVADAIPRLTQLFPGGHEQIYIDRDRIMFHYYVFAGPIH